MVDRITRALELAGQAAAVDAGSEAHSGITYTRTRTRILQPRPSHVRRQCILGDPGADPLATDQYRLLRTRLLQRMGANGWRTLGVTSPAGQEGKTLTSINLALSIARDAKHSVLLVDADLRRPSIARAIGFETQAGLAEYLRGEAPLEALLVNPGVDRLVVLPGAGAVAQASELLGSPRMAALVSELRARYASRIVLFDLPPVLVGDDVVVLSTLLDAFLLVIEDGRTDPREVRLAAELLQGANVAGSVLNKAALGAKGYEYT